MFIFIFLFTITENINNLQRYGMRNDLDFLMGENHGGMYHNNRPFNLGTIKIYDMRFLYFKVK